MGGGGDVVCLGVEMYSCVFFCIFNFYFFVLFYVAFVMIGVAKYFVIFIQPSFVSFF